MKQLILINGTMGAGKSAVSNQLLRLLAPSVYLDGDWCWNMNPFVANGENKAMVLDNIAYLLRSFLSNSGYQYVIFCWVIHQEEIFEEIFSRLEGMEYQPVKITLDVSPGALCQRLLGDVRAGVRQEDVIERSLARLPLYEKMDTVHLDVSRRTPEEAAQWIASFVQEGDGTCG